MGCRGPGEGLGLVVFLSWGDGLEALQRLEQWTRRLGRAAGKAPGRGLVGKLSSATSAGATFPEIVQSDGELDLAPSPLSCFLSWRAGGVGTARGAVCH